MGRGPGSIRRCLPVRRFGKGIWFAPRYLLEGGLSNESLCGCCNRGRAGRAVEWSDGGGRAHLPSEDVRTGDLLCRDLCSRDLRSGDVCSPNVRAETQPREDMPPGDHLRAADLYTRDLRPGYLHACHVCPGDLRSVDVCPGHVRAGHVRPEAVPQDLPSVDVLCGDVRAGDVLSVRTMW